VRPPPLEVGDSADAQRLRVEEAVRDVAAMTRLTCGPPKTPTPELLGCWPAHWASPAFVSLHLQNAEDGYKVSILESGRGLFSGARHLCPIQDRLAERLDLRLGGGVVERDPRVTCPREAH